MGKPSKPQQQLRMLFLVFIFIGSLIFLFFELIPIQIYSESLPPPDLKGHLPLSSAIQKLRQSEDLRNHVLNIKEISQLLWAVQGITHGPGHRTVPSAGATYPLEIYVIHNGSTTLKKGVYNYIPDSHQLNNVSYVQNTSMLLSSLTGKDQDAVSNVSTTFLILADYSRTTQRYNSYHPLYDYRGIQYVHLEVGHAVQNFLLQLTSLNLKSRVIANFTSQQIKSFLDTTLDPMAVLPVGINENMDSLLITAKKLVLDNQEGLTVEQAIAKRKSVRDYQDGKIPLSVISDLLNDSMRIPQIWEANSHLDFRLVAGEIDGLQNGVYEYFLENNSLIQLLEGDFRQDLREAGLNQIWIETAQLNIVISGDTNWINQQSNPILYHRIMMYKIGMIAQNIYLKSASHRLGTVVVGAFYEGSTSLVVDTPDTYTPIYIIPIGLTPEFFLEPAITQIPLTELARISGLYSYIPLYISLYLSLPIIKRRMTRKMRWIHCISGTITFFGALFHFMTLHGHIRGFWDFLNLNSYYTAFQFSLSTLLSLPTTRYNIGMFVAVVTIVLGTITAVTGFSVGLKFVKKRKLTRNIHKYSIFLTIGLMMLHALLNGTIFAPKPFVFLLLNILALDLYLIIFYSPEFYKTIQKNEILSQSEY
jgi:SagB-type dehydrogenase family enzyme